MADVKPLKISEYQALDSFLSDWPLGYSFGQLIDMIKEGHEDIIVWVPFESESGEDLVERITKREEEMVGAIRMAGGMNELPTPDDEEDERKLFVCYWGDSYSNPGLEKRRIYAFGADNGYSPEDTAVIDDLELGESYSNHDHGFYSHVVTRVK